MPLYEYRCSECDAKFELLRSIAVRGDPATCPRGHTTASAFFLGSQPGVLLMKNDQGRMLAVQLVAVDACGVDYCKVGSTSASFGLTATGIS